ncbi:MAG: bifunctional riboflavin kinase/FAD synthetase [Ignavibacteriaceae bacterium]|nr:bifunctional riboflavin kinase/FAD synthetase [Ignavibacteriaceae bacterium]
MRVYNDLFLIEKNDNTIITIGTFDGVHLGHQEIFNVLINKSKTSGCRSFVITFEPHPRTIIQPNSQLKLLTTFQEKVEILEKMGIDNLLVIPFTKEFSQLTSEEFFRKYILEGLGVKKMVIGYDLHFGKGRDGDEQKIRELGSVNNFEVQKTEAVTINETVVSSSNIRNALSEGEVKNAAQLLGRNYSFSGLVVGGDKRGRELGFPTANIKLENEFKLIPKNGVYAVKVLLENSIFNGVMNIGLRPTFKETTIVLSEVHILNFNEDIYGKQIGVEFIARIRDEKKFASKEELIKQIEIDKQKTSKLLTN